jgi:hypothetical protein
LQTAKQPRRTNASVWGLPAFEAWLTIFKQVAKTRQKTHEIARYFTKGVAHLAGEQFLKPPWRVQCGERQREGL